MHEPFFTTEADEMSRAFDPTNTDAQPDGQASAPEPPVDRVMNGGARATGTAASPARRNMAHHSVCPFCGSVNETTTGACRQCAMENTPATRQATRNKIGPWFVWQSRNPSAPGMNWVTLMSLIEKGRITPRSVVRGPTTGQLWRFAARVKGVSREFGACWHCGGELQKAARLCTSCKRLQQPPINPDALLEVGSDIAMSPIHKSVADPAHRGLLSLTPPEPVRREVSPGASPFSTIPPAPQAPAAERAGVPFDPSVPIVDMGDDALPSGMEFRAFQMEGDQAGARPRRGSVWRILLAAVLTMLVVAPVLYLNPQVRPHYVKWYEQLRGWLQSPRTRPVAPAPSPAADPNPDAMGPALSPPNPPVNASIFEPATATPATPLFTVPVVSVGNAPPPTTTQAPPPMVDIGPPAKPAPALAPAGSDAVSHIEISSSEPRSAERRSWELYEKAIKSEQHEDYAAAVQQYQWIEQLRLPEGSGPSDVQARLQRAKQLQKQQAR